MSEEGPRPGFRPKPLPKASVEAPEQPHWRILPKEDRERLHRRAQDEFRKWRPLGARTRRRIVRVVLGTVLAFGVAGLLFVGRRPWAFLVAGVVSGSVACFLPMRGLVYPVVYGLSGMLSILVTLGSDAMSALGVLYLGCGTLLFASVGVLFSMDEDLRTMDGEK